MADIDRLHVIDKSALSGRNYFVSLIEQGRFCALLSDSDMERIQLESLSLLAEQTEHYNKGSSSSIRVEKAQDLLSSVLYTAGIQLKSYPSPDDAIDALKSESLEQLFHMGLKRIDRKIIIAKQMHLGIKKCLFKTQNVFYRSTVIDGINGFFKLYNPEFSAQEIHITADYPTFNSVHDLEGIEFIEKYLQNITYENKFCLYFSANTVHHLLCGLDENYQQILMNIYEPVLTASLGCILNHRAVRDLHLIYSDLDVLTKLFAEKTSDEVEILLKKTLEKLITELACPSGMAVYLRNSISAIAVSVKNAALLGNLDKVFLIPSYLENNPQIVLSYGERMDDKAYNQILNEIMRCGNAAHKAEIIINKIHSLGDLLEILRDADLTQEELLCLFQKFPSSGITALFKQYPNDYFLSDESEIKIYSSLQSFKNLLPEEVKKQLENAVQVLHFDIE